MDTNFFQFFQIFFKAEAVLPYSGSVFFNILYRANSKGYYAYGNSIFLVRAILLLLEIIRVIGSSFRLLETSISTKSFILANGNGFSG